MTYSHCLTSQEIISLIKYKRDNIFPEDEFLRHIFSKAEDWEDELSLLCYSLGKAALSVQREGESSMLGVVEDVYSLSDEMLVSLQEMDVSFVDLMLKNIRERTETLEDALGNIQRKLIEFDYSGILR